MARQWGENAFSLDNLVICKWDINAQEFTGDVVSLADGMTFTVEPQADSPTQRGYGKIKRKATVLTSANFTISAGGIDHEAYAVMVGRASSSSDSTPNRIRTTDVYGGPAYQLPYFGAIGIGYTDDGGRAIVGFKSGKLNTAPSYTLNGEEYDYHYVGS
jgi:hypothetical protein